ncbi:RagB/SusD family nutrient uptake outer membrane protein [Chitinophaga caseinilytica]|uniref:RagB/SusD family nutrient uptake outer membrane protein n=1 Tax=Chitinophaga caseinilytica TaxID=2267521 RepID=A0ABZ2ZAW9_9BACT
MKMKQNSLYISIIAAGLAFSACKNEAIPNPNAPTMEEITKNPTIGELNNLVTGVEASMRSRMGLYIDITGSIGREFFRYSTTDPRLSGSMLGKGSLVISGADFLASTPWTMRYNTIKTCNLLMTGVKNSKALTRDQQRNGYNAYAKTIMAHQLLMVLNLSYDNGLRLEVTDPNNPGPKVNRAQALEGIAKLLDDANTLLNSAEFEFELSSGFEGFDDVAGFRKFNRALAARVAVYREQWGAALTALTASFIDQTAGANLNTGPKHLYSSASGDEENDVFINNMSDANIRLIHPSFALDLEAGDDRINKASAPRATPLSVDDLPESPRDFPISASLESPFPIIRNEELILIYAEAAAQSNQLANAADALNIIRTRHGLTARLDLDTKDKVINEMLKQRRYSLWGEGHRWIDMRRYNRLAQLPIDRPDDNVWKELPLPEAEANR